MCMSHKGQNALIRKNGTNNRIYKAMTLQITLWNMIEKQKLYQKLFFLEPIQIDCFAKNSLSARFGSVRSKRAMRWTIFSLDVISATIWQSSGKSDVKKNTHFLLSFWKTNLFFFPKNIRSSSKKYAHHFKGVEKKKSSCNFQQTNWIVHSNLLFI